MCDTYTYIYHCMYTVCTHIFIIAKRWLYSPTIDPASKSRKPICMMMNIISKCMYILYKLNSTRIFHTHPWHRYPWQPPLDTTCLRQLDDFEPRLYAIAMLPGIFVLEIPRKTCSAPGDTLVQWTLNFKINRFLDIIFTYIPEKLKWAGWRILTFNRKMNLQTQISHC